MRFKLFLAFALVIAAATIAAAQRPDAVNIGPYRSSPAFAEVLLRKTELEADLESMMLNYTDENPLVKQARFELGQLSKDLDRIFAVPPADAGKLTTALGKLIVRKAAVTTEQYVLEQKYGGDHPAVKKARKRTEVFERAVNEILR